MESTAAGAVGLAAGPAARPATGWHRLLVERPRPDWARRRPGAHWLVVATVCLGAFMGQLDASIVTLAFPALRHSFHAGLGAVEWVSLAYLLTLVSLVSAVGRMADMVGRKSLYLIGFGVFTVASAACGLAPSLAVLCVLRILQAVGAALLQANSVALIADSMPAGTLGRGIGVQGAAQALGLALGPAVGGALVSAGGWRLVFLVNVPVGIVGVAAGVLFLPRSRTFAAQARFDWWGLTWFVPAVCLALVALNLLPRRGSAALIVALLVGAVAAGVLFVRRERAAANPMLDLHALAAPGYPSALCAALLSYLVLFGVLLVVPLYAEDSLGLSAAGAGLRLTALPVALGLVAPAAGRFADRHGARLATASGMVLTATGLAVLAGARTSCGLLLGLALAGAGLGAFTPANNSWLMGHAARGTSGSTGGLLNMTRGLGTSLGVATTGLVFSLAAGRGATARVAGEHGFTATCWFLVAVCLLTAAVCALPGRAVSPPAADPASPRR